MQINFNPEDMRMMVSALEQSILMSDDPARIARMQAITGRLARGIELDPEKRAKAYELTKRLKRERHYDDKRKGN